MSLDPTGKYIPMKSDHTMRYPWVCDILISDRNMKKWHILLNRISKNCFGYLKKSKFYYTNKKSYEIKKLSQGPICIIKFSFWIPQNNRNFFFPYEVKTPKY